MLNRDQMLERTDQAYAARARGDKAALGTAWTKDATYRMASDPSLIARFPAGPGAARPAVEDIVDLIAFHDLERIDAVVEGNRAAVLWRVTASVDGTAPVTTELFDLIELDAEGRIASLVQFCDTAALAQRLG